MDGSPHPPHDQTRGSRSRGLGRGLGALIPGADRAEGTGIVDIPVDRIRPNAKQPRGEAQDAPLAELAASIQEQGILQPVLIRPTTDGGYELVAGERRWRAARIAGLHTIPAVVRDLDDRGALEAALVENLQREDLNAIDRAKAYHRLTEEFGLSQDAVARHVGRSQPSVANTVRLLSLPPEVQASLESGRITEGHARALLALDDRALLLDLWRVVEAKGLSVRETEAATKRRHISREIPVQRAGERSEINIIQQNLTSVLGTQVKVVLAGGGRGEIRITFYSPDDLERLMVALGARTPSA